ncbi:MAG TPA: hypothetical protein VI278_02175 [Nitrososphaeraceae archaeon]
MAVQYSSDSQQQPGAAPPGPLTGNKTSGQILPTGGKHCGLKWRVLVLSE